MLQNAIFWPNGSQDHKLPFLTFIPNAPRIVNLKGHGCGVKIKVAMPFFSEKSPILVKRAWQPSFLRHAHALLDLHKGIPGL